MSANQRQRFIHNFLDRVIDQPRQIRDRLRSIRKSKQCISNTLRDTRCRKCTAHTEKCWIHLAKYNTLRIKPSNVIGGGRKRTKAEIDRRYGNKLAKYALCNRQGICVDSNHTTDAAARFANDSHGTPFSNNSKIRGNTVFRLKATKTIPANREIFTSYGREYWNR
ncbi:Hypothetical predicted protein [Paramuricea clavata]|uniref:Uncharacterized protein n=1 Tax=Paramuricea clavata TaxID=317549 RepID=A0A7D9I8Q6_PARCT|nr:Hypothetical predicted protein [Paramuricea clavata]